MSEVKDKARYFVNPTLFFNRIIEDIDRLHLKPLNRFLEKLALEPVSINVSAELRGVAGIADLTAKAQTLTSELEGLHCELDSYFEPWYKGKPVEGVPEKLVPLGQELQFPLATAGRSVQRDLEKILEACVL